MFQAGWSAGDGSDGVVMVRPVDDQENASGESLGYAQCPADDAGESVVSIAGVLLYDRSTP